MPSLEDEYKKTVQEARQELDTIINQEKEKGLPIKVLIGEGEPTEEILRVVTEAAIDLLIMLGHEEGRLEHFIFGRSNEELVRLLPCSILIVKQEPAPVKLFER
jgi:nucleotide-binding universal stress UspA family protein